MKAVWPLDKNRPGGSIVSCYRLECTLAAVENSESGASGRRRATEHHNLLARFRIWHEEKVPLKIDVAPLQV
jgi:hypothetical protein